MHGHDGLGAELVDGWRNVAGRPQRVGYTCGERAVEVVYRFGRAGLLVEVDGVTLPGIRLHSASAGQVELGVGGRWRAILVRRVGDVSYVDSAFGSAALVAVPRFPDPATNQQAGSLLAPMPGGVLRVLAAVGDAVLAGQPLVVLEAMKMEHTVAAGSRGYARRAARRAGRPGGRRAGAGRGRRRRRGTVSGGPLARGW